MIYFIQDTGSGAIKIGTSRNPVARMEGLQAGHASRLVLLAVMDGGVIEEHALHRRFKRLRGEWFEPSSDLVDFIQTQAMPVIRQTTQPIVARQQSEDRDFTPIDLASYDKLTVWVVALLAVNKRHDRYRFSVSKIARFVMTKGGSKAERQKMYDDMERMVFTIRSMSREEVDRILADAPPEIKETRLWRSTCRF